MINLRDYDVILINSSAGKDSQAMLDVVTEAARNQDVADRIVVVHADLGEAEWNGTKELAEEQAKHYGHRFEVVSRKKCSLLDEIRARKKWPSSTTRYCTSYYKREPVMVLMTRLVRELHETGKVNTWDRPARILNCYGFRAEESPARAKRQTFSVNERSTNGRRSVDDWLPIHDWTVAQVWERIKAAGTRHHYAYDLGMTRLSCRFCIFAPKSQLLISAKANPELFAKYVAVEQEIGHTFRKSLALVEVQKSVDDNEGVAADDGCWNM